MNVAVAPWSDVAGSPGAQHPHGATVHHTRQETRQWHGQTRDARQPTTSTRTRQHASLLHMGTSVISVDTRVESSMSTTSSRGQSGRTQRCQCTTHPTSHQLTPHHAPHAAVSATTSRARQRQHEAGHEAPQHGQHEASGHPNDTPARSDDPQGEVPSGKASQGDA